MTHLKKIFMKKEVPEKVKKDSYQSVLEIGPLVTGWKKYELTVVVPFHHDQRRRPVQQVGRVRRHQLDGAGVQLDRSNVLFPVVLDVPSLLQPGNQ
jgi:hypothetical protein